ncbi:hypothetical protein LSAT2_017822, partial [Lamellibrachia satsuma]
MQRLAVLASEVTGVQFDMRLWQPQLLKEEWKCDEVSAAVHQPTAETAADTVDETVQLQVPCVSYKICSSL